MMLFSCCMGSDERREKLRRTVDVVVGMRRRCS
jgi:hypothetical protein